MKEKQIFNWVIYPMLSVSFALIFNGASKEQLEAIIILLLVLLLIVVFIVGKLSLSFLKCVVSRHAPTILLSIFSGYLTKWSVEISGSNPEILWLIVFGYVFGCLLCRLLNFIRLAKK